MADKIVQMIIKEPTNSTLGTSILVENVGNDSAVELLVTVSYKTTAGTLVYYIQEHEMSDIQKDTYRALLDTGLAPAKNSAEWGFPP